ncbi:MAG: glycosyltransferase family 2 protein [Sinobacteraceae bacterium]|nr:glycosyltransferase family 2 protein [Nevskiaceae bacterium]
MRGAQLPKVSIILPTYNRADTILRAVRSVQAQTFEDWELIVVDDGSEDDTVALIADADVRLTVIRQENRGFTEARNTALRAARGEYCAFLDSDDEFMPHHLELCVAFLEAFKDEPFVSTELLEDFGRGRVVNHYRIETSDWYPKKAALIGSHCFDLPPGETDDYLRAYASREPIGEWGRHIIERLRPARPAFLYRGDIFKHMRFDFMIAITATVVRRTVFETLGLPEPRWSGASDFHFLARMCKSYRANYLSVPTFVKHEFGLDGALPLYGHIVTGKSALAFARQWQEAWDDLFWNDAPRDAELRGMRALRLYWLSRVALNSGDRALALQCLDEATAALPRFWSAVGLRWLMTCLPGVQLPRRALRTLDMGARACRRVLQFN